MKSVFMILVCVLAAALAGCYPNQNNVDKAIAEVEYQIGDESSQFQQGVETGSLVTQQVAETLRLVPFIPFAKEAGVIAGLASVVLNALQGLRGIKLKKAVTEVVSGAENFKAISPPEVVQTFKDEQAKAQSVDTKVMVAKLKAAI